MVGRTVKSLLRRLSAHRTYTIRHGLAKGLKRRGGLGFVPQIGPLSKEERFLMRLEVTGQTVYDVGAFEGLFTLFFARAVGPAGKVVTFEPNPENYSAIRENVRLNGFKNVDIRSIGLGTERRRVSMVVPHGEYGRGSAEEDIKSQLLREKGSMTIEVELDSLDGQIAAGLPRPDLIKIDVEGLEWAVLTGMTVTIARHKPKLYIEIHGADVPKKLANIQRVVTFLSANTYSIHHVETDSIITPANAPRAKEGHLFCT